MPDLRSIMTNPSKVKGDVWERAVRDHLAAAGFDVERTRAGYTRDHGDLHVGPRVGRGPALIVQAKNHSRIDLAGWLTQLGAQTADARADHGVLVVKRRQCGAGRAYAVMELDALLGLLRAAGFVTDVITTTEETS